MSTIISKADVLARIADATGLTKVKTAEVLDALAEIIETAAKDGQTVITPLGRFVPKTRAARIGRNPRTGESIEIAAKTTVSFKPAKPKS